MKRGFNFSCLFLTISSMALFNFEQQPKKKGSSRLNSLSYFEDLHRLMRTAIDLIRFGFPLKRSEFFDCFHGLTAAAGRVTVTNRLCG